MLSKVLEVWKFRGWFVTQGSGKGFWGKTAKLKGNQGVSEEVVLLHLISYSNRVSEVLDLPRLGNEKNSKEVFSWGDPLTRGKGQMSLSMWHPTPVLLARKSHGRRSLVGCSPWGR